MPTDPAYRAVDPDDFPAMIATDRYAQRSPDFEEIIARTEEHFWNPEDPDYVDFATPWPPRRRSSRLVRPREQHRRLGPPRRGAAHPAHERERALERLEHPPRRAGRAQPVGLAVRHLPRPGRAGVRRQSGARGGAARARVHALRAGALRRRRAPVGDTVGTLLGELVSTPGRLQEGRRHADARRGRRHGGLHDALQDRQRPAPPPRLPARHDGRGVPPPLREDLGALDHAATSIPRSTTPSRTGRSSASTRCSSTS